VKIKGTNPNPAGKHGKPIAIPMKFEDALKKMLATPPPHEKPTPVKAQKKRTARKRASDHK